MRLTFILSILLLSFIKPVFADGGLKLQKVDSNVYAIVGDLKNRSAQNFGNNATFGFVITSKGIVLIDSGATYQGAQKIDELIKTVSQQPIVKVINTGGQDHRWLGNQYFKQLGADIVASAKSVEDQKHRVKDEFFMLENQVGVKQVEGTQAVYADKVFDGQLKFMVGDTVFEIYHSGPAHTPGDSFVWLPKQRIVFSGDIVFSERILGILDHSTSKGWLEAFKAMAALEPRWVIPGHGHATTLKKATKDSFDYIKFLREAVAKFMDNEGDIADISQIDQSKFNYLISFDLLSGRNAQRVYSEMEWE